MKAEEQLLRERLLTALGQEIRRCRRCRLWRGATNAVPGEGPADAEVMLIGQNPGTEEDRLGRPFMGRSGKFLNTILKNNRMIRESLFITNIVKHRTAKMREKFRSDFELAKLLLLHS